MSLSRRLPCGVADLENQKTHRSLSISLRNGPLTMFTSLLNDDAGFILSAELVLVATIMVIGLIVGLSEIQHAMVSELNDVADAMGSINHSYFYTGFSATSSMSGALKSASRGSSFFDPMDDCDMNQASLSCNAPVLESLVF
jgi:hypothetical protein